MPIPSAATDPVGTLQVIREYLEGRELDAESRQDLLDILDGVPPLIASRFSMKARCKHRNALDKRDYVKHPRAR